MYEPKRKVNIHDTPYLIVWFGIVNNPNMRILIVEIPEPVSQPGLPVGEAHPVGRLWVKGQPVAVQRHHQQQASPHHTPPNS